MTDVLNWRCEGQLQAKERPHKKAKLPISWSWIYSSSNWEMFLLFKPPWHSMMYYYSGPNWMRSCLCSLFGAFLVMHIAMWFSSFSVKIFSFYLCGEDSLVWQEMVFSMVWHRGQVLAWWFLTELGKRLVVSKQSGKKRPWVIKSYKDPELYKNLPFRTSLVVQ